MQSSLADRVTEQLRAAIVAGQLAPGERLAEATLASRLGVSRSPVREALTRLEALGLVRSSTNYSAYVWNPTESDVDEIINLRLMMEIYASEQVVSTLTQYDFDQLEGEIARQERFIASQDFIRLVSSDRQFHEYMIRKTGNGRLLGWWGQIMGQWEVLVARRWRFDTTRVIPRVLYDHRLILDALKAHDLERLITLHRTINKEVCEETKAMLREQAAQAEQPTLTSSQV
ncbi:MAG: GntR family transcriptional regulator [Anaerolineae bacterium]|nr:GntR family transcriptional regulator [Candidatus Roseilinea sp.]MDW8450083.1 GntR family transcriptional regulator [Anaerolineae bacterium]